MNIKELIEKLQQYPEDMEVEIWRGWCMESQQDCYYDLNDWEVTEEGKLSFG